MQEPEHSGGKSRRRSTPWTLKGFDTRHRRRFSLQPKFDVPWIHAALVGWAVCLAAPWALVGRVIFVLFTTDSKLSRKNG